VLDQSARASLRSALWALRRRLGQSLGVDGERIGLRNEQSLWIDTREFERLEVSNPIEALALCRGELLEGFEDDWVLSARERHRERVIRLLEGLAGTREARGQMREAIDLTRCQVDIDPFDEDAHRRLMTRLAAAGDRSGAVRTYRALSDRLRAELGVAPSLLTRELIEQLRAEPAAPAGDAPRSLTAGVLPLTGRDRELAQLKRVWEGVMEGSGAVVVIRGEAGIGKTRLATEMRIHAAASGGQTAGGAALDLGGSAPLSLWAELIRELLPGLAMPPAEAAWPQDLGVLASELPADFARGASPIGAVAPDLQRTRLFEAVVALLAWAAREPCAARARRRPQCRWSEP
jgi:DNA-binding SARP family transcriptional activator